MGRDPQPRYGRCLHQPSRGKNSVAIYSGLVSHYHLGVG